MKALALNVLETSFIYFDVNNGTTELIIMIEGLNSLKDSNYLEILLESLKCRDFNNL